MQVNPTLAISVRIQIQILECVPARITALLLAFASFCVKVRALLWAQLLALIDARYKLGLMDGQRDINVLQTPNAHTTNPNLQRDLNQIISAGLPGFELYAVAQD